MKETVLSVIRHVMTAAGAILVARGYINEGALQEIVGLLLGLVGALWGPIDEYIAANKVKKLPPESQAILK